MDALTRRRFLLASGVAGGGVLAAGTTAITLDALFGGADPSAVPDRQVSKLVLVTLYGGNDGLNTVIPYTDRAYYAARPELAYKPEKVLQLDEKLGLNPVLSGLKRLWDQRQAAIVLGVGYPKPDRSHFRSMDIWQTCSPAAPIKSGWIGRWLDGTDAPPEMAVSLESVLPPVLAGVTRAGACVRLGGLRLPPGMDTGMIAALGKTAPEESPMQARAAVGYADLLRVERLIRESERHSSSPSVEDQRVLPATGTGGSSALAAQLALVAQCVEVGVPTQVYSVSLGGFDTHAQERAGHEILLRQLDQALAGFVERMAKTEAGRQVTVVVYSEFGRRVRANASDGTDHGTAGPVFVLGPRVRGGFYGEQPSLKDLDDGDLKATTDFRQVFGTVLGSVLGAEPARYLEGYEADPLGFVPA